MSERIISAERGNDRFRARRRQSRRRALIAYGVGICILSGVSVWGLWQNTVRIKTIEVIGVDQSLAYIAETAMRGDYFGSIPRDSIFFFPSFNIRANILADHPGIAAVSISRKGLTGLSIKIDNRIPIARWCGASPAIASSTRVSDLAEDCYFFDANGFMYATTSVAMPLNSFVVYESLSSEQNPLGTRLPSTNYFPATFHFARQLNVLGSPVTSIVFHDGEADQYLASGTRITYVIGNEENAFNAFSSARSGFDLADGSIEYIDLRFNGRVYLKRK